MKGPTGKPFDGIYSNPRFIHTAASLVGAIVAVQVKNGCIYEGVLRTFSQKVDFVLEMVHEVGSKRFGQPGFLISEINPKNVMEKMIFNIQDVVMLSVTNIDLDYAARDPFTDTAISRYNGQVTERELEPWDGGFSANETVTELGEASEDAINGWDAAEMFRTNEEKYGVKSSFDSNLLDYTIPLQKQNTEEYKIQEEKASKIAHEIESGSHYKNRLALENGDEEERFSAVVRPDNAASSSNNRFTHNAHRGKKIQVVRPVRSSPSPTTHPNSRMPPHQQTYHKTTGPNTLTSNSQNKVITSANKPVPPCAQSPSPKPVTSPSLTARQPSTSPSSQSSQHSAMQQFSASSSRSAVLNPNGPNAPMPQNTDNRKLNGDTPRSMKESLNKEVASADASHKNTDRVKEVPDKKPISKKPYDDKSEDLKKFHEKFKMVDSKDAKESRKESMMKKSDSKGSESSLEAKQSHEQKSKDAKDGSSTPESNIPDATKGSTLNPNAKEFVLNPNAKSFTPRAIPMPTNVLPPPPPPPPPVQQPPPRLHAQSPVIAVPQHPLMPGMPHPVFTNVAPHYVLPGTPVSMPMASPYTPATSMAQQPPRFRKVFQETSLSNEGELSKKLSHSYQHMNKLCYTLPVTLPRNDSSQSIHVQAATGQPILAPPTVPTPQFTIQYHSPGIIHSSGPPQPQLATYAAQNSFQMYQMVGPRMLAPQPLGMVPAPGAYGDSPHVPTPIFRFVFPVNPQAVTGVQHPGGPSGNSGQHSSSSTPQSQTPSLHPAPSPVHQQPPPQAPQHGQPPTPTGHPGNPATPQVIYHGQLTAQHPLHINPGSAGHHPYQVYNAGPQPILMLPHQPGPHPPHPSTFQALQNHYHHAQSQGPHAGTPNQILPHPSVQMMPTSTAMGHGQVPVSNSPYVPHSQANDTAIIGSFIERFYQ